MLGNRKRERCNRIVLKSEYHLVTCTTLPYSLTADVGRCLSGGLPACMTRFADTTVSTASAVSTGADSECSRTHNGLSVEAPHAAHSLVVPLGLGFTATKRVPLRSQLYSSNKRNLRHAAGAVLRLFDGDSNIPLSRSGLRPPQARTPERSSSRACVGSRGASVGDRRDTLRLAAGASRSCLTRVPSVRGTAVRVPDAPVRQRDRATRLPLPSSRCRGRT